MSAQYNRSNNFFFHSKRHAAGGIATSPNQIGTIYYTRITPPTAKMAKRDLTLADLMRHVPMDVDVGVLPEDRVLIRNVIATMCTLRPSKMFCTVNVERIATGYNVVASIADGEDFDFSSNDMDIIGSVSHLRVIGTTVTRRHNSLQLRVKVVAADQPVNLTETVVTHIRKRQRLLQN
jgi:hypothetical protein